MNTDVPTREKRAFKSRKIIMKIIVHTMEYTGEKADSPLTLRNYESSDFSRYQIIYNECFSEMRSCLSINPINCCDKEENLLKKRQKIFILEDNKKIIGSVAVYGNEIDDLIVAKSHQRRGYGERLLKFAVSYLQKNKISPIRLYVADWNQGALKMYIKNGFKITHTEIIN